MTMSYADKRRAQTRQLAADAGITITRRPSGAFHLHGKGVDLLVRDLADADLTSTFRQQGEARRSERYGHRGPKSLEVFGS